MTELERELLDALRKAVSAADDLRFCLNTRKLAGDIIADRTTRNIVEARAAIAKAERHYEEQE